MKVFSVIKYIEDQEKLGKSRKQIRLNLERWAGSCEGLTKEEMNEKYLVTIDSWMVERKEEK